MHQRHSRRPRHSYNKNKFSSGCSFCGKNLEGLPHRCKYCGQIHCSDHLLPEDHKCSGLNQEKTFSFRRNSYTPRREYEDTEVNYTPIIYKEHPNKFKRNNYKPHFRFPRIRLPRIGKLLFSFIIALVSYFLAVLFIDNSIFLWIEFFACAYFTILLFRVAAPKLPPIIRIVLFCVSNLKCLYPSIRFSFVTIRSCRQGLPVSTIFSFGKNFSIPSYATQIVVAF